MTIIATRPTPCCPYCRRLWQRKLPDRGRGPALAVIAHEDWCPIATGEADGGALIPDPPTFARLRIRP